MASTLMSPPVAAQGLLTLPPGALGFASFAGRGAPAPATDGDAELKAEADGTKSRSTSASSSPAQSCAFAFDWSPAATSVASPSPAFVLPLLFGLDEVERATEEEEPWRAEPIKVALPSLGREGPATDLAAAPVESCTAAGEAIPPPPAAPPALSLEMFLAPGEVHGPPPPTFAPAPPAAPLAAPDAVGALGGGLLALAPPPPPGPALGDEELPTRGSSLHAQGLCRPCAFVYTKGCANGLACAFCHLCGPEEKRMRKRERRGGLAGQAVPRADAWHLAPFGMPFAPLLAPMLARPR